MTTGHVTKIERVSSRGRVMEEPAITTRGYKLADPAFGRCRHHAEHATYVKTLDETASLIARGFSIWMGAKGKRPSLIAPKSLRIVRQDETDISK